MKKFNVGEVYSYTDIFGGESIQIKIEKIDNGKIYFTEIIPVALDSDMPIVRDKIVIKEIEVDELGNESFKVWEYKGYSGYIHATAENTDKENARQIIERTNFNADYNVIEESLQSLKTIDIEIICGVLMDIALEFKEKYGKSKLEIFAYHVNDINYLLFDNKNKVLKEVEILIGTIADNMN